MKILITKNLVGLTEKEYGYYKDISEMLTKEAYLNPRFKLLQLSAKLDYGTQNTSRLIKRIYGMSFTNLVTLHRINHFDIQIRKYLDKDVNFNITQLIKESGFNTRSSFYYNFKEIKGVSPKECYNL
jgi:AraC-like DNA-binding protein